MIMAPIDLVKVLTAAAPIVASLATIANKSENTEKKENKEDNEKRVNVNIYNTFYTNSEKDAEMAAATISKQLIRGVTYSDTHYML